MSEQTIAQLCPTAASLLGSHFVNSINDPGVARVVAGTLATLGGNFDNAGKGVVASAAIGNEARAVGAAGVRFIIANEMVNAAGELLRVFNNVTQSDSVAAN